MQSMFDVGNLLRFCGLFMVIGGVMNAVAGFTSAEKFATLGLNYLIYLGIALGAIQIITGGLTQLLYKKPSNMILLILLAVVVIVLNLLVFIIPISTGLSINVFSLIFSCVIPVVYIIIAIKAKQGAKEL